MILSFAVFFCFRERTAVLKGGLLRFDICNPSNIRIICRNQPIFLKTQFIVFEPLNHVLVQCQLTFKLWLNCRNASQLAGHTPKLGYRVIVNVLFWSCAYLVYVNHLQHYLAFNHVIMAISHPTFLSLQKSWRMCCVNLQFRQFYPCE